MWKRSRAVGTTLKMDTPEKNLAIATSNFEDSPVFNYISNLSPIVPVKPKQTVHAFNSLTFSSPPSVFTSPEIGILKETRFSLRRHHFSDPSQPESSQSGSKNNTSEGVSVAVQLSDLSAGQLECSTSVSSEGEITIELPDENSGLIIELANTLKYDCGSPDGDVVPSDAIKTEIVPHMAGTLASFDKILMEDSKWKHHSVKNEINLRNICSIERNREAWNWVTLVSDGTDLLNFDLSINEEHFEGQNHISVDPGTISFISTVLQLPQDNANDLEKMESVDTITSCKQCEIGDTVTQSRENGDLKETDPPSAILSSTLLDKLVVGDSSDEVNHGGIKCRQASCKPGSRKHRSIRRRCLVFETAGAHKNKPTYSCNSSSSVSIRSDCKVASNEKQLVEIDIGSGCSSSILPGIGLCDSPSLRRQQIIVPNSIDSCNSLKPGQNPLDKVSTLNTLESELVPCENEAQVTENAPQTSTFADGEEFDHGSPKGKRFKLEHVGESKTCKRCNCKRSKCLKLYCECFAASLYCVEPCSCQDCFNKPIHENTVLETRRQIESRNPLAFAPKVIRSIDAAPDIGDETKTPASARHKRGCHCKRSSCLKKYCECFQSGVGCSISCRCIGCKNTFGRYDEAQETDSRMEESEACEKNALDVSLQIVKEDEKKHLHLPFTPSEISRAPSQESKAKALARSVQSMNEDEEHPDLPITPFSDISRPPIRLPFTFSGKHPLSSLTAAKTSPGLSTSQKLGTSYSFRFQPKFETRLQMIPEDETPEALNSSSDVMLASPNSKRVSPPNREFGSSTAWMSGRKLILRSIPAFPSLPPPGEL